MFIVFLILNYLETDLQQWTDSTETLFVFQNELYDHLFYHTGLVARKPVFGGSDKARLKPVSLATETS